MADEVILAKANPAWSKLFGEEKARLLSELGSHFIAIEHFGSTAVPGLSAKPIIDMLGGVGSMAGADALLEPLCRMGWETSAEFNATLPDRRFLRRRAGEIRTHHLHLVVYEGKQWQRWLKFRDCLRAMPDLAQQYEKLKYELAAKHWDDREAYTAAKTEFVSSVTTAY